jgi:hypothetical protein
MRQVAKHRADNAAKYPATDASSNPVVRKMVAAALENPAACSRAK